MEFICCNPFESDFYMNIFTRHYKSILKLIFIMSLLFCKNSATAQKCGCTDSFAKNLDLKATLNNGKCKYNSFNIRPILVSNLPKTLNESSGLIFWKKSLWSLNDDSDTSIYQLNIVSGNVLQKIKLSNVINKDWEEISQDSSYIYIADSGNNYQGNRKDLNILRVSKKSFLEEKPEIDTISFSYSNQKNFQLQKSNTTDFDLEAFVVSKDSIYLFSKQWKSKKTTLYVLPKLPGNYTAKALGTLNVNGLITGATYNETKKQVVLCGYSKYLKPFLYLLYDYPDYDFFRGNHRKIKIKLPFHQVEGIATDGVFYYLTNEKFYYKSFIHVPSALWKIDLSGVLK